MAADSVVPPSTEPRVAVSTFWKVLFSCWPAKISRHWTSGRPASIMTENWRVKIGQFLGVDARAEGGQVKFLALLGHLGGRDLLAAQLVLQLGLAGGVGLAADGGTFLVSALICVYRHFLILLLLKTDSSKLVSILLPNFLMLKSPAWKAATTKTL